MANNIPRAEKTITDQGMVILSERLETMRSIAMGIHVGVGSEDETLREWGLSHFIEHMTFRGTNRRNVGDIARELDAVGGKINAYTAKDSTVYFAMVIDEHIDIAIDILGDIFLNSIYDPKDIEIEKNVAIEEIKMYEDAEDEYIHDLFAETILGGHAAGRTALGTKETLKAITRDEILLYRKKHYTPDNLIISIAGNIEHAEVVKKLERIFSSFSGTRAPFTRTLPNLAGKMNIISKKTEQVHICLGSKGVSHLDELRFAVIALDNVIAGSMSSRLFQNIREKRGLAYSIYSYNLPFKDFGIYGIYAGTSKENVEEVITEILKEIKNIKKNGITKEELTRAKDYLKGSLVLGLESSSSRMSWLSSSYYRYGRVLTIDEVFDKIESVTHDNIVKLAEDIFKNQYLTLIAIGDYAEGEFPLKEIKID
ncbi:MAG: pitrilysin family protein [Candidatus Saganbacteria bacterium]|nr:pitrilysin family protein [Candidatus Saganbacteria bacterium]